MQILTKLIHGPVGKFELLLNTRLKELQEDSTVIVNDIKYQILVSGNLSALIVYNTTKKKVVTYTENLVNRFDK